MFFGDKLEIYWIQQPIPKPRILNFNKLNQSQSFCKASGFDEKQSKRFGKPVLIGPKIHEISEFVFSELVVGFDEQLLI